MRAVQDAGASTERQRLDALRQQFEAVASDGGPVSPRALPADYEATATTGYRVRRTFRLTEDWIGHVRAGAMCKASPIELALLGLEPALAQVEPERLLFLDLETTGLGAGAANLAFVVGLGFWAGDRVSVEQHVLLDPSVEAVMLDAVAKRFEQAQAVVSYNGKSFDLPLLRSRFVLNRRRLPEPEAHLDLLHLARRVHRARSWRKTLKEVEARVIGFERGPDIDSASVGSRYAHHLRTGDSAPLIDVVTHNEHDITSLVALTGFYGRPSAHLEALDLASAARTMRRAGDLQRARQMADAALLGESGPVTLGARADIAKACGDRDQALADFESLAALVDDPQVRLKLAKLYEHHRKEPGQALLVAQLGTGEGVEGEARRRGRLKRKVERAAARVRAAGDGLESND